MSQIEIHIQQFDGPMDLLLYLVQKDELHPSEISIAEICDQFLAHIEGIEETQLGTAGDFLFMASRLMALKARQLLPRDLQEDVELMEFDEEREALIRQVLLYQKIKEVAEDFKNLEQKQWGCFGRGRREVLRGEEDQNTDVAEQGVWEMYHAFHALLKKKRSDSIHTIEVDNVTIEDCQQSIEQQLRFAGKATFVELLRGDHRKVSLSVHFMAMLEMVKTDNLVFRQPTSESLLWIYRKKENPDFAHELSKDMTDWTPDPRFKLGLASMLKSKVVQPSSSLDLEAILKKVESQVALGQNVSDKDLQKWLTLGESGMPSCDLMGELWYQSKIPNQMPILKSVSLSKSLRISHKNRSQLNTQMCNKSHQKISPNQIRKGFESYCLTHSVKN